MERLCASDMSSICVFRWNNAIRGKKTVRNLKDK